MPSILLVALIWLGVVEGLVAPTRIHFLRPFVVTSSWRYPASTTTQVLDRGLCQHPSRWPLRLGAVNKASKMELGIKTAQLLMDSRKQQEFKKDIREAFPLVPEPVVDGCIEITADAFKTLAPEELQLALRPGWIEKNRSKLRRPIVDLVMEHEVMKGIPVMSDSAKASLVERLVDLALDQVIEESSGLLSAPEIRLAGLEQQLRAVKSEMGPYRLFWYRLRTRPLRFATGFVLAAAALYVKQNEPLFAAVSSFLSSSYAAAVTVSNVLLGKTLWVMAFLRNKISWLVALTQKKFS